MIIQFTVENFLSFKEPATLSLAASALKEKQTRSDEIVFELEDGTFVGWYDGGLNYGNSVKHDNYITPIKLK